MGGGGRGVRVHVIMLIEVSLCMYSFAKSCKCILMQKKNYGNSNISPCG
jgi:hypothetical protein